MHVVRAQLPPVGVPVEDETGAMQWRFDVAGRGFRDTTRQLHAPMRRFLVVRWCGNDYQLVCLLVVVLLPCRWYHEFLPLHLLSCFQLRCSCRDRCQLGLFEVIVVRFRHPMC